MGKVCSSCKEEKPYSDYSKNRSRNDGYAHYCKVCARAAFIQWKEGNRDSWRESKRKAYDGNVEKERERARQRRKDNPETNRKHNATYPRNHPERRNAVNYVNRAVARGDLLPANSQKCVHCGEKAEEYHHPSYAKEDWLVVVALCRSCHRQHHTRLSRESVRSK